jgi:hypothetical protein
LRERGFEVGGLKKQCDLCQQEHSRQFKGVPDTERTGCCLDRLLELQPDFQEQRNRLQEAIETRGHYVLFLPKFHPELNFIELYWVSDVP